MQVNYTHISVVLDRSGSMETIQDDMIGGYNNFLAEQQLVAGKGTISLVRFNDQVDTVYHFIDLKKAKRLDRTILSPTGQTSLLDAIGQTIDSTKKVLATMSALDRPTTIIILIITDGQENSSCKFTTKQIADKVKRQQTVDNWEFVFLGANQDAILTAQSLGIKAAQSLTYATNGGGTQQALSSVSRNMTSNRLGNSTLAFTSEDWAIQNTYGVDFPSINSLYFPSSDGFYFTVIEGNDFGRVFLLDKQETLIGRSDEADIQVDDEKVSRKHLKLMLMSNQKGQQWVKVVDVGSKHGIYINGTRVFDHDLKTNDKLKIGNTILKFEIKDPLDISYHDKLYQQATRDPLTGLSNRNHFQNEFRKFISIAARYNRPLSIILLDIDFFKRINDTYGHDVGDSVLKEVAKIIMHHVRNHDVAARFGGNKFAMLLPEKVISGAVVVAERIRVALENKDFTHIGCDHHVTISIGISEYPSSGLDADEVIKCADEALYQAKSGGHNRVCSYTCTLPTNQPYLAADLAGVITSAHPTLSGELLLDDPIWGAVLGEFALIPAGEFLMGAENGLDNEKPIHKVIISQSFEIGKYVVTQQEWEAVMGNNPSLIKGARLPVEFVSWKDVQLFIHKLNEKSVKYLYRLPTEAEWEYAARAGSTGDYTGDLEEMAWYGYNSGNLTHPVGEKKPNAWGLYDMHGNVLEWCSDWYGAYSYKTITDPSGATSGSQRIQRGGSCDSLPQFCRLASRHYDLPDASNSNGGFRLVRRAR